MLLGILGTLPKTRALDVYTYIIECRISLRKINCIISFAAAKFQDNRLVVSKEITAPVAFHRMVTVKNLGCRRLDQTVECLVFAEFSQFILSHNVYSPF